MHYSFGSWSVLNHKNFLMEPTKEMREEKKIVYHSQVSEEKCKCQTSDLKDLMLLVLQGLHFLLFQAMTMENNSKYIVYISL